jgi:hypothetical protein
VKIRAMLAALGLTVSAAAFTVAASESPAMAAGCFNGAIAVQYEGIGIYPDQTHAWTTTSRCNDINMKVAGGSVTACAIFIDHTQSCNHWTGVGTGWVTIATNVKDGTRFRLGVQGDDRMFGINMYLAF